MKKKVIYIMGHARSGSTILNIVLGNLPEVFAAGEVSNFTVSDMDTEEFCSCKAKVVDCDFWSEVRRSVLQEYKAESLDFKSLTRSVENWRNAVPIGSTESKALARQRYTALASRHYNAIFKRSQCEWLVDASKCPLRVHCLINADEFDFYVIHVVRDPRAVCHSLNKAWKKNAEAGIQMDQKPASYLKAIKQLYLNLILVRRVKKLVSAERFLQVRNEDLVFRTQRTMDELQAFLGIDCGKLMSNMENNVPLEQEHNVAGNRLRMQQNIVLKYDSTWVKKVSKFHYWTASVILWPMLFALGYSVNPQKNMDRSEGSA